MNKAAVANLVATLAAMGALIASTIMMLPMVSNKKPALVAACVLIVLALAMIFLSSFWGPG